MYDYYIIYPVIHCQVFVTSKSEAGIQHDYIIGILENMPIS